ncbi:MAG: hypothetical protein HYZ28_14355 [Myxococcales bacterium]|nr:hypothetical protein [Myxococcales bacterium]
MLDAWGFRYLTALTWVKDRVGTGFWLRGQAEFLLLAKRGDFPPPAWGEAPPGVLFAPRGRHSEKPSEVAELIERLYPELPKLELFARAARPGWSAWGNEVPETEAPCSAT